MSRLGPARGILLLACGAALLTGCARTQRPVPLDPEALLAAVRAQREDAPTSDAPLTLEEATARMRAASPEIREARAAWSVADAVARTKTPPPNPTVSLGPLLLGGSDVLSHATWGLELALGWVVPIANPPRLADDLNRVRAGAAFAEAAAVERSSYLALRASYAATALAQEELRVRDELLQTAQAAAEAGRRMAEAGQATGVEERLLELDAERANLEVVTASAAATRTRSRLAGDVGLRHEVLLPPGADRLPTLPEAVPSQDALEAQALAAHPALDVLRAEYLVAEKELRIECAAANPNLELGATLEREPPDSRIGLPLGIELPIFDRNQVGIARAVAARRAVRERYRAELARRFAAIEEARVALEGKRTVLDTLTTRVAPAAARTLQAAKAGLEAGSVDALRYLEALRAERSTAVELAAARREVYEAWLALEHAAGVPLLAFPADAAPAHGGE